MKAKVKFDKNQLKSFLIEHVEKFVFGGMVLVALLLCWSALGRKPYSGVPSDLTKKADGVKTRIAQSTPPDPLPDLPTKRDLNRMLHGALIAVNPSLFPMSEFARPYADLKVRRTQPKLLAVQDPKASAGFGAIAMSDRGLGRDRFAAGRNPSGLLMDDPMGGGAGASMMDPSMMMGAMPGMTSPMPAPAMMDPEYGKEMMQQQQTMQEAAAGGMSGMPDGYGDMMMGPQMRGRRAKKPPKKPVEKKVKAKVVQEPEKMALEVPPGATLKGRYWVSVVGLIPSWDQEGEFEKVFREATKRLRTDRPQYVYCDVERAEVLSPGEVGEYEPLDMEAVVDDMEKWAAVYPDMIDKKYLSPSVDVTAPLPPLVLANHNPDAIRHPKIPLAGEASAEENKAAAAAAATAEEEEPKSKSRRRGGNRIRPGMPGMGGMMPGMNGLAGLAKEKIEYQLFRFFDFEVEPGKTYKYRVRLALDNPNYDVEPQYLQSPDLAKERDIFTDWSEPTPEVFVPLGSELLAGDINPKEPAAKIMVRQFDREKAVTAVHEFELARGATANADGIEVPLPKLGPAAGIVDEPVKEKVDFRTDATMVDLVGGGKLVGGPSGTKAPGRMLVMRSDGELALLSEFSDAARFEQEADKLKEAKDAGKPKEPGAAAEAGAMPGPDYGQFFQDGPAKKKRGK